MRLIDPREVLDKLTATDLDAHDIDAVLRLVGVVNDLTDSLVRLKGEVR